MAINQTLAIIFYCLFVLVSVLELVFAYIPKEMARRIVKPFCLTFLLLGSGSLLYPFEDPDWVYMAALLCALLGDVFMLFKKRREMLTLGGIFFLSAHIVITMAFARVTEMSLDTLRLHVGGSMVIGSLLAGLFFYQKTKSAYYTIAGWIYFGILATLFGVSTSLLIEGAAFAGIFMLLGSIFFLISDSLIGLFTIKKLKSRRPDFYIMLTYLLAESLICVSFLSAAGIF